ncbi:MAG: hypothetical protein M9899_01455 [Bdellovibrionaceae bacterium]|nr:hypothetical protein [Pseudobdellovibrionaceae bacterium]
MRRSPRYNISRCFQGPQNGTYKFLSALFVTGAFLLTSPESYALFLPETGTIKSKLVEMKDSSETHIDLQGFIAPPMADKFIEIASTLPPAPHRILFKLNSRSGGSVQEGLKIIEAIDELKLNGYQFDSTVLNGETCGSMCVPLFLQGQKRTAGAVSVFMLHGVVPNAFTNIPNESRTRDYLKLFIRAGVSEEWIEQKWEDGVFTTPGYFWITGQRLVDEKSGMISDLIPAHEVLEPVRPPFDPNIRPR